jgi:hypothetical protein
MYTFSQKNENKKMAFQNGSSRNIVSPNGIHKTETNILINDAILSK